MDALRERKAAEHIYSITAFNYPEAPVGSRDWCLFWDGWQARATLTTTPSATEPAHLAVKLAAFREAIRGHIGGEEYALISEVVRAIASRATEPDRNAARYLWLRDNGSLTWVPFRSQWQMSADKCDKAVDDEMDRAAIATRAATKD